MDPWTTTPGARLTDPSIVRTLPVTVVPAWRSAVPLMTVSAAGRAAGEGRGAVDDDDAADAALDPGVRPDDDQRVDMVAARDGGIVPDGKHDAA